jgi:hypothetical protein
MSPEQSTTTRATERPPTRCPDGKPARGMTAGISDSTCGPSSVARVTTNSRKMARSRGGTLLSPACAVRTADRVPLPDGMRGASGQIIHSSFVVGGVGRSVELDVQVTPSVLVVDALEGERADECTPTGFADARVHGSVWPCQGLRTSSSWPIANRSRALTVPPAATAMISKLARPRTRRRSGAQGHLPDPSVAPGQSTSREVSPGVMMTPVDMRV